MATVWAIVGRWRVGMPVPAPVCYLSLERDTMRILHFSDVHIGVESYGRTDPATGLSTRLLDFLRSFDEVVDFAIEERVDLALFCGDAYKSRDPSQTHQREFARRIARLSFADIPVFLLLGNHDMPHITSRATALEIFRTLDVSNVYIGDSLRVYTVPTRSGPVQVLALPWIRRSDFLTREDTRMMSPPEVNEAIQRRLADGIAARAAELDPGAQRCSPVTSRWPRRRPAQSSR